jgi:hypothetical protein
LTFAALLAIVRVLIQLTDAGSWESFNPYGLNSVVAWIAVELAIAALFVGPTARTTALSAMFFISVVADIALSAITVGAPLVAQALGHAALFSGTVPTVATYAALVAWWVGAMICIVGSLQQQTGWRLAGRIAALWVVLFGANVLMPQMPVFAPADVEPSNASWWETVYAARRAESKPAPRPEAARFEKLQPKLLQEQLAHLAAARKDQTNIYALALAGWADQDVFVKELDGALSSIASVLPIGGRIVRLINRRDSAKTTPLATASNFAAAVNAIANLMDKENDVFILFMTSHGGQTGFALQLPAGATELTPEQVASALNGAGIKNRVVIVSACYSGIFLPPLANENSIVITAADATHTSFGCAPERDWTYFGDAFFHQSLHPGADFETAFDHARVLIHGWEMMDRATPSNPQGSFGPALVAKLAPFFAINPQP